MFTLDLPVALPGFGAAVLDLAPRCGPRGHATVQQGCVIVTEVLQGPEQAGGGDYIADIFASTGDDHGAVPIDSASLHQGCSHTQLIYMKHLQAGVRMKSGWKAPLGGVGHYDPRDTADWQFGQTRMVIGIETEDHGIVVMSPMGMAQVSGIVARDWVKDGAMADKGWEFANFAFGGSDFVIIFQEEADFVLTVAHAPEDAPGAGVNSVPSLQGEKYGCFGGVTTCSDAPQTPPASPADM